MKVALVYDRVNKFGGAERVLLTLKKIFPEAPLFTLVYSPKNANWAKKFKVIPTFVNKIPLFRQRHELLAPIAPLAFETLDFGQYDVVISVTSADAKSIITKPNQVHICYCLTPTRYFWSGESEYSRDPKLRMLPEFIKIFLRYLDLVTASRPDFYISISKEVSRRLKKYYQKDSSVVYPSIDDVFFSKNPVSAEKRSYYLVVSRLVPYKKVDLVVKTFKKLDLPLIVVGDGSQRWSLEKIAGSKIVFVGQVPDSQLVELYRHAIATVFPQHEDFGLVPVESQACGTPVIAYKAGGAVETVINNKTGIFFDKQSEASLANAIKLLQKSQLKTSDCVRNAKRFSQAKFFTEFKKQFKVATGLQS